MRIIGNFLWCVFGGGINAILWGLAGVICCCTLVGIPMGIQCFKFARFVIWPFGKEIYYSNHIVNFIWNLLWIFSFGWELAVISFSIGLIWCLTILGIPFGIQCFKFARLALMPFGVEIV